MSEGSVVPHPTFEDFGLPDGLGSISVTPGGDQMPRSKLWVQVGLRDEHASHDSNIELILELANHDGEILACEHRRVGILRGFHSVALWVRLPSDAPAQYMERLQIVRRDGSVRQFEWQVTVFEQRIACELCVSRREVAPGTTVELVLRNTGPTELIFGEEYALQRFESRWIDVPLEDPERSSELIWGLVMHVLRPGEAWSQEATVGSHVRPGRHRLVKEIDSEVVRGAETNLTAEFVVLEA